MKRLHDANKIIDRSCSKYFYHIHPKSGWGNDPNGLTYFKGKYHVFFQCNPFENNNKQIFWGHASSTDLINWKSESFALAPDKEYDKDGCFSGSAIVCHDKLYLFYTGHKNKRHAYSEVVCVAVSKDGKNFEKVISNPIIRAPEQNTFRFRDPKVWKEDRFKLVIGGESQDGRGQIHLYESENILGPWKYQGILAKANSDEGNMWECPDFFTLNNQPILLASPKGLNTDYKNGFESIFLIQDFEDKQSIDRRIETLDNGVDFYAPQTFFDRRNKRRILFGWFGLPGEQEKESDNQQSGALTLPRQLVWKCNKLNMVPLEELKQLREREVFNGKKVDQTISSSSEIFLQGNLVSFSLLLSSRSAVYSLEYSGEKLTLSIKDNLRNRLNTSQIAKIEEVRLFLDKGLTELFINDGEHVWTNKCQLANDTKVNYEGSESLKIFSLQSAFK